MKTKLSPTSESVGEILEPIFKKVPNHPGVAHYLIHCYDNPALAQQGLTAARAYAKIAPASAHANHMPSHIFTRVGSWEESVQSNQRSEALAAAAELPAGNAEARDQRLHAMDYMAYAFLQSGRVKDATTLLTNMNALPSVTGLTHIGDYALAAIPARCALELSKWQQASELQVRKDGVPWTQALTWMAIGVGGARSGNLKRAGEANQALAQLRDALAKQSNSYWSKQVEVQRLEVEAWMAQKSGSTEGGSEVDDHGSGPGREHGEILGHSRGDHSGARDAGPDAAGAEASGGGAGGI